MKNIFRKVLALTLTIALCLTLVPAAFAAPDLSSVNLQNNFDYSCGSVEIVDAGADGAVFSRKLTVTPHNSGAVYAAVMPVDASGNSLGLETRYVRLDSANTLTYFRTGCRYFAVQPVQPLPDAGTGVMSFSAVADETTVSLDCMATVNMSREMAQIVDTRKDRPEMDDITFTCHIRFTSDKVTLDTATLKLDSSIFEVLHISKAADGYGYDVICDLKDNWKSTTDGDLVSKLMKTMTLTADANLPKTSGTLYAAGWITVSNIPVRQLGTTTFRVPMATVGIDLTTMAPAGPVPGTQPSVPVIPDVPTDDPSGVSRFLETGIHNTFMSGYPDGTFGPDKGIKRCEVAQMFYNLLINKNVAITASFTDVKPGDWYYNAVMTLASMGIITGRSDGSFDPQAGITRAEFAAIVARFANAIDASAAFTDVPADHWAAKYIATASAYGWVTGYPDGTFAPGKGIKRCEAATIVNRMLDRAADRDALSKGARVFSDVPVSHWAWAQIAEATTIHEYTRDAGVEIWN